MQAVLRLAFCLFVLTACSPAPPIQPSPTASRQVSPSPAPTRTAAPTATEIAEIDNYAIYIADIRFLELGPGSQVVSPLAVRAELAPGYEGKVRVELVDAAGRLLARHILVLASNQLHIQIPFEINRPTLDARLTVSTQDEYLRTQALNSVELILLAAGEARIQPPAEARITIAQPAAGDSLPANSIHVAGQAYTLPNRPVNIQLITREGRVLASREVYPLFAQGAAIGDFQMDFEINVVEETWVQIAVSELGGPGSRVVHFAGVEVLVLP